MRVLVVDDHALFTDAIVPVLEDMGMDVVAVAGTAQEGTRLAAQHEPEVIMVDLGLPDASGLTLGKQLIEDHPNAKVMVLSGRNDPHAVNDAVTSGFHGYITKDIPMNRFPERVRAALNGQKVVPPPPQPERFYGSSPEDASVELLSRQLTNRELEVLGHLVRGSDNKQIATQLTVSPNTVRTHVQSILTKLQVKSRLQAAAFAVRHRLVRVEPMRRRA
jgi:two-component system, NarL family, nitrate/nitrite response regulator NarL